MGFEGVDIRQSGDRIVIRALLLDSSGEKVTSGSADLYLYELQSDGSLKSFDFNDETFKTTALTTESATMTHQTGNNGTTNTGIWTKVLSTLTGFTRGAIYLAVVNHASGSPPWQAREFQYGSASLPSGRTVESQSHLAACAAAGNYDHDINAGVDRVLDEDGSTVLRTLTPAEAISFTGANWTNGTKTITKVGAFTNYIFKTGDQVTLSAGTGVTTGVYAIASRVSDDAITLSTDCNGASGDISDNSIAGTIDNARIMRKVS